MGERASAMDTDGGGFEADLTEPRAMAHDAFGAAFLERVLNLPRVLASIDRILGPSFQLGPIGAGPGRRFARLTASGQFLPNSPEDRIEPEVIK